MAEKEIPRKQTAGRGGCDEKKACLLGNGAADEETMEQSWNSFGSMEGDDSVFNLLSGPRHSSGLECTDAVRIGKVTGRRAA